MAEVPDAEGPPDVEPAIEPADDAREAYQSPELKDLGDASDLTQTGAATSGLDGIYS